jgi:hypothetical protein
MSEIPFDHSNFAFRIVDITTERTLDNGFTIEVHIAKTITRYNQFNSTKSDVSQRITMDRNQVRYTSDVSCKLSLAHRGLMQLQVAAPSFSGDYVYGYSVNFNTYSGGDFKTKLVLLNSVQ